MVNFLDGGFFHETRALLQNQTFPQLNWNFIIHLTLMFGAEVAVCLPLLNLE